MKKENHSVQTFDNVDEAMKQYFYLTQKTLSSFTRAKVK